MATWWIDKPHLLGSRNPTDTDLKHLREDGFGILVSLLCEKEQAPGYDIARVADMDYTRYNIPVRDYCSPTLEQLEQFVRLVADSKSSGKKTIVHCQGGIGRTGTFAAAYWIAQGKSAEEAMQHVRKTQRHAVETPEQEEILVEFAGTVSSRP